jgi:hypothetical protein
MPSQRETDPSQAAGTAAQKQCDAALYLHQPQECQPETDDSVLRCKSRAQKFYEIEMIEAQF